NICGIEAEWAPPSNDGYGGRTTETASTVNFGCTTRNAEAALMISLLSFQISLDFCDQKSALSSSRREYSTYNRRGFCPSGLGGGGLGGDGLNLPRPDDQVRWKGSQGAPEARPPGDDCNEDTLVWSTNAPPAVPSGLRFMETPSVPASADV